MLSPPILLTQYIIVNIKFGGGQNLYLSADVQLFIIIQY